MNLRLLLFIGILGLLAGGTWWLARRITSTESVSVAAPTHEPDYYFTDAKVTTLDQQGQRAAVMTAPRIVHHPDDDSSEVFEPRFEYFGAGDPPWHGRADHGLMPSGGQLIKLDGNVTMNRAAHDSTAPLIIHTDRLTVNLDTNIGSTSDPVQITQGSTYMTGVGMLAYFNDNRMVLQSNVKGRYVRQH